MSFLGGGRFEPGTVPVGDLDPDNALPRPDRHRDRPARPPSRSPELWPQPSAYPPFPARPGEPPGRRPGTRECCATAAPTARPIALRQSVSGCLGLGTYLARSSLGLAPVLDRLVHSRDVVAQSDPDLFIVDSMVGVRGDDPHALDLPPGNLRRRLDDLVRQLGGNVAQSADDGLAREAQCSVSQRSFPSLTSSAAASAASARSARRPSTPLVTDPRPRRECGHPGA